MYFDEFLSKLENAVGHRPKRSGEGYSSRCPAHEDATPSLFVSEGSDGRILLKCFAGCSVEEICSQLGMAVSNLFPKEETRHNADPYQTEYIYTSETGIPQNF